MKKPVRGLRSCVLADYASPEAVAPFHEYLAKFVARLVAGWLCWLGLAGNRPAATHFSLLRQKKVSKEKATLLSATLRFATGSLRYSLQAGSAQTRLRLIQRAALIRLKLRSSAQTEGVGRMRDRSPYCPFSRKKGQFNLLPHPSWLGL